MCEYEDYLAVFMDRGLRWVKSAIVCGQVRVGVY